MSRTHRNPRIILASKSPRRRYLLEQAGLKVTVVPSDYEEESAALADPPEYARALAEEKAAAVARRYPHDWVIGADTVVVAGKQILGKPGSRTEARSMLSKLSGQIHRVYTGWCIQHLSRGHHFSESVQTEVRFKNLTPAEIEWYIQSGEPFDKAGAYAIQGLGTFLVRSIRGSYTNVVGLPVCEVVEHLLQSGIIGLDAGSRTMTEDTADRGQRVS